jgi:hypothetical protein
MESAKDGSASTADSSALIEVLRRIEAKAKRFFDRLREERFCGYTAEQPRFSSNAIRDIVPTSVHERAVARTRSRVGIVARATSPILRVEKLSKFPRLLGDGYLVGAHSDDRALERARITQRSIRRFSSERDGIILLTCS